MFKKGNTYRNRKGSRGGVPRSGAQTKAANSLSSRPSEAKKLNRKRALLREGNTAIPGSKKGNVEGDVRFPERKGRDPELSSKGTMCQLGITNKA